MAYRITELCTECGRCVGVCPTRAIAVVNLHHWIDPNICDDIAMCTRYCPQPGAIVLIADGHAESEREVGSQ